MNEFQNKLIVKEEPYQNGLFPKVPKVGKRGSAIILTGGCNNDLIVSEHTTAKEIRQGKYNRLVEVSTLPYLKELRFHSPSKETHYSFDVYVKAVIQVNNPIVFYENRNIDVDAYFNNLFSLDVKKITGRYSILNYAGMDDDLTQRLSSYNTIDESTGFSYRISVVDASPGEKAQEYVQKYGKQQLDAELKKNARMLAASFSKNYEDALMTEVAEGKMSEAEAIMKINEYNNLNFESQVKRLNTLREDGLISDMQARTFVRPVLKGLWTDEKMLQLNDNAQEKETQELNIDQFYTED